MRAVVIGASGGIGAALVRRLVADARWTAVHALSRSPAPAPDQAIAGPIDLTDADSIAAAAAAIAAPIDLLLIASGFLHGADHGPEKALRDLDPARLAHAFAVNSIGPALALRAFAPLLPRHGRSVIGCLSARVGSISDNRAGGWYGYRASKAALNQIVRTAAIELTRTRPDAICVTLHPGTVDTGLSRPFQANVPPGRLFTPDEAAARLLAVVDALTPEASGRCFAWDGQEIQP